jgi:hypothetical protein
MRTRGRWLDVNRLTFKQTAPVLVQQPSADDEQDTEDQEPDIPGQRSPQVVSDVMDAKDLVIDQPFDNVEDSPPGDDQPEVETPVGSEPSLPPSADCGDGTCQDQEPSSDVEESIGQCVHLEPGDRLHRLFVTDHVVPLQDLVQDDAIDEAPEAEAIEQSLQFRRRLTDDR